MEKQKITDAELEQVNGGSREDEERKYKDQHGYIVRDMFGNVTFTDKTGNVGTFTAAEWSKLAGKWAYTGNPEFYMTTINNNELRGVLSGM